jgi:hypothetical protein
MRGMTTVMRMNARGKLYGVQVQTAGSAPMGGPGGRGMMNNSGSRPVFALPEQPVRVGQSWTDSTTFEEGGTVTNMLATYRLERIESRGSARVAVLSINGTSASRTPQGSMIMSVTGEVSLDASNNRLAAVMMEMSGTMASPRGDVPVRMLLNQRLY